MNYLYLRFFLTRRTMPPLLEALSVGNSVSTREQYLRSRLSRAWEFPYRGKRVVYHPFDREGAVMVGVIGRQRSELVSAPPERNFEPEEVHMWHTANCFIDTSQDTDGQRVAVQYHPRVGSPLPLLEALTHFINQSDFDSPYQIAVNAISEERDFWEFVERNIGSITEIKFKYIAPNILGGGDETRQNLRELRDDANMQELDVSIINRDGNINPDNDRVRESVDYLTSGGGSLEAKNGRKVVYSSEKNIVNKKIEEDTRVPEVRDRNVIRRIIKDLFGR